MKNLLLLLFIVSVNLIFARVDTTRISKYKLGFRTGMYVKDNYFGYLTLNRGKYEFSFGPSFGKQFSKNILFNGLDLNCRYYPKGFRMGVDFFFEFDFLNKWGNQYGVKTFTNPLYFGTEISDKFKLQIYNTQFFIQTGFDFKFFEHLYIGTSIGLGYSLVKKEFIQENLTYLNSIEKDFNATGIFQISCGARF